MADTEQKVEEDVMAGEEEGNDEVYYVWLVRDENALIMLLGRDICHEEEGCRDGRGGSKASGDAGNVGPTKQ